PLSSQPKEQAKKQPGQQPPQKPANAQPISSHTVIGATKKLPKRQAWKNPPLRQSGWNKKDINMYRSSLQDEADFQSAIKLATERATEKATREATASKAGECAANLIRETDFDNLTIGRLAGLEESAVEAIRKEQRAKI